MHIERCTPGSARGIRKPQPLRAGRRRMPTLRPKAGQSVTLRMNCRELARNATVVPMARERPSVFIHHPPPPPSHLSPVAQHAIALPTASQMLSSPEYTGCRIPLAPPNSPDVRRTKAVDRSATKPPPFVAPRHWLPAVWLQSAPARSVFAPLAAPRMA